MAKKLKLLSPQEHREHEAGVTLNRRVASIYSGQKKRAARDLEEFVSTHGRMPGSDRFEIDYSSEWLKDFIRRTIGTPCPCKCLKRITVDNFVVDHRTPIAQGGTFASANLCVMLKKCNNLKGGVMSAFEFVQFKETVEKLLPKVVVDDVYRRMRLGSNAMSVGPRKFAKVKA